MSRRARDGTAELSRDQIFRRKRGQGNIILPCSADHEQDWQPYPVDPYSCYLRDYTYIHTWYYAILTISSDSDQPSAFLVTGSFPTAQESEG